MGSDRWAVGTGIKDRGKEHISVVCKFSNLHNVTEPFKSSSQMSGVFKLPRPSHPPLGVPGTAELTSGCGWGISNQLPGSLEIAGIYKAAESREPWATRGMARSLRMAWAHLCGFCTQSSAWSRVDAKRCLFSRTEATSAPGPISLSTLGWEGRGAHLGVHF